MGGGGEGREETDVITLAITDVPHQHCLVPLTSTQLVKPKKKKREKTLTLLFASMNIHSGRDSVALATDIKQASSLSPH